MARERLPIAALHEHMEGKRSRGRQRKIWMDNVREHLKERNINLNWQGDQKQRDLEESYKSLIVSLEERKEEKDAETEIS